MSVTGTGQNAGRAKGSMNDSYAVRRATRELFALVLDLQERLDECERKVKGVDVKGDRIDP